MAKIVARKPKNKTEKLPMPAFARILICIGIGVVAGIIVGFTISWQYSPLVLWDVSGVSLLFWLWLTLHGLDAGETEEFAVRENPGRALADVILIIASLISLVAVGALLFESSNSHGLTQIFQIAFGVVSIVISWAVIHTVYALRYASEYFSSKGGIDFNTKEDPTYSDFMYLAFTIGMTYQVSDTTLESNAFRRLAINHALLSFVFGTAIIASTINLVAGLGK